MSTMCYKCGQQTAKVPMTTYCNKASEELLTAVTNATYSTYVYTNDLLGRRTSKNDEHYGYNVRDELVSANDISYAYDDIGNRTSAEGKTYTANNLNQYIAIDDFAPEYDADGNQTLIKTETGIWSVQYNAENRPIRWQSGDTVITMAFDRMDRRVEMRTMKDGAETLQRFVYDNYLCIQQLCGTDNALFQSYVWDPTEPIATRPLIFLPASSSPFYTFHDGNKNVSDLVPASGAPIHYAYTPFGAPTASAPSENPFRFSSEVYDKPLGLVYYNYRHYHPLQGAFFSRDPCEDLLGPYLFLSNNVLQKYDFCGLTSCPVDYWKVVENYTFRIWMATGNSIDVDARARIESEITDSLKEEISKSEPDLGKIIKNIEDATGAYAKGKRTGALIAILGWSTGPYISRWHMEVTVRFYERVNCETTSYAKSFSRSEENLFIYLFNKSNLTDFAESVAQAAASLVKEISEE